MMADDDDEVKRNIDAANKLINANRLDAAYLLIDKNNKLLDAEVKKTKDAEKKKKDDKK
jgi:hypothetical protein